MAERIVQEESLVAVADAIRAKGGTTDALSFPTGFADAIEAIQAGGGGGGGVWFQTGQRIPTEELRTSYPEALGLPIDAFETQPDIIIWFKEVSASIQNPNTEEMYVCIGTSGLLTGCQMWCYKSGQYLPFFAAKPITIAYSGSTNAYYVPCPPSSLISTALIAGNTYRWIAVGGLS